MFNNSYAFKVYNDLENSFKNEGEFLQAVKMILKSIESELTEVDQKNKSTDSKGFLRIRS